MHEAYCIATYKFSRDVILRMIEFQDLHGFIFKDHLLSIPELHSIVIVLKDLILWMTSYPRKQRKLRPLKIYTHTVS